MEESSKQLLGAVEITKDIVKDVEKSVKNIADFTKKINHYATQNTTNLLDMVLFGAVHLEASDIHLEPEEKQAKLRIRIDGILQDTAFFEQGIYHNLVSRLKLLSKLRLNITDQPQDGRFTIAVKDTLIEIRTSSLPTQYGESIVMRILNPKNLRLEALGLRKDLYKTIEKEILSPSGMIMVTGPTSSGKTTTLYAFLMKIQNPKIKILTIEDPIEYHIKGISQTQVAPDKGYDFSSGLRSIIRQNPDVILVSEIRDAETAKIASQASLTGHLVLSTLHTGDAVGSIPRLISLGTELSSIASSLRMAMGQRLVRKVCKKCSTLVKPNAGQLTELKKGLKSIPKSVGVPDLNKVKIAKASEKGCSACNYSGYKERTGLFELFLVDAEIKNVILKNLPVSDIKALAVKKGMITIYQSGLIEIALGNTTFEELKRLVEEEE